jgi:outer membrane protein assembly factor BamA
MFFLRPSSERRPALINPIRRIVTSWSFTANRPVVIGHAKTGSGLDYGRFSPTWLLLVILLSNSAGISADSIRVFEPRPRPASVPNDDVLVANGATIGEISYKIADIFDTSNPKENYYIFRLANRLHINTKQFVVRDDLLFNTGDQYSPDLLSESERILRSKSYLYDAEIRPIHYHNNQVDIEVKTRDVWTLSGGINFSRKGGENSYGYEIQEDNFAGLGKTVRIKRDTNELRTETEFLYFDPFLTEQRFELTLGYSYNSDGRNKLFQLRRPFYSLETTWATGFTANTFSRQEIIYKDGAEYDYYYHDEEYFDLRGGYSRGQIGNLTTRWQLGFTVDSNKFDPTNATINLNSVPDDRVLAYPWIQYDSLVNRYIKAYRINLINRTEDINLGASYYIRLGWAHSNFGSDRNAMIYDINYYNTNQTFSDHLLLVSVGGSGRLGEGFSENLLFNSELRYYYPMFNDQMFYTELNFDVAHNLDDENQLLLGGESGLRGYPARVQDGNRRLLFRMEQRYYTDWHVLQLLYVGGALFFDIGKAWTPGETVEEHPGFLKDAGLGLRLSPSRTSRGSIIHLDLAYALDAQEDTKKFQILVSTESRF